MSWKVTYTPRAAKQLKRLPERIRVIAQTLQIDLSLYGPVRGDWPNYSKLGEKIHHCHLNYSYVACWEVLAEGELKIIEVYYVGTRKDAPY